MEIQPLDMVCYTHAEPINNNYKLETIRKSNLMVSSRCVMRFMTTGIWSLLLHMDAFDWF